MKKIIFTLLALVGTMSMNAQVMKIMKGTKVVATYTADQADNVVFEEAPAVTTTGTAKATINGVETDVNWVQLWEDGPKFAEYNVGAANNKAEDYGGYYCWGGTYKNGPDENGGYYTWNDDHNTTNDGSGNLTSTEDTATKLWGSNWRMPTQAELEALLANCDVEWTTINDVSGRKFTGKGAYSSNSVFLPAAGGYCFGGDVYGQGDYGRYWSSTPDGSDAAYSLNFSSGYQDVYNDHRFPGYSVRAVLEEAAGPAPATTGTAKATIGENNVDVKWVQLWEDGPKFAEYNVGAANNKAEDYGGYYCWGGTYKNGPDENGGYYTWSDDHNTTNTGSGNLTSTEDTATKLWGSNWRMPTQEELSNLLAKCSVEWTTVNGVNGRKFTGNGAYSGNSVFLPAAGSCDYGDVYGQGYSGFYWSSAPDGSIYAYDLLINPSYQGVINDPRRSGESVRAVLAE